MRTTSWRARLVLGALTMLVVSSTDELRAGAADRETVRHRLSVSQDGVIALGTASDDSPSVVAIFRPNRGAYPQSPALRLGGEDAVVSTDGATLAFATRRRGLNILAMAGTNGAGEKTLSRGLFSGDHPIEVGADGAVIFAQHSWEGGKAIIVTYRLSYLDGTNRRERELGADGGSFVGRGNRVVGQGADGRLRVSDVAGKSSTALGEGRYPVGTLDGDHVLFSRDRTVYTINLSTRQEVAVGRGWDFVTSADGRHVLTLDGDMDAPQMTLIDTAVGTTTGVAVPPGRVTLPWPRRAYGSFIFHIAATPKRSAGVWGVPFGKDGTPERLIDFADAKTDR